MLIRVRGGKEGIKEYLEEGRKDGRGYSRDELDERVILSGDLGLTDDVIKNMDREGEHYLHITLSFKEDHIDREKLQQITDEFKEFAMTAYAEDEYNFYAEAHLPKIKSYIDQRTGEFVERKPHIHVVIPEHNLLSERNLNPFGKVDQQTKFLEAFQEHINGKYGLASPKDNRRVEFTDESTVIERYRGDYFKGTNRELKEQILLDAMNTDRFEEFHTLVAKRGEVRTRNAGRENEYLNVKLNGAAKGVNLKEHVFSREFIELPQAEKQARLAGEIQRCYEDAQPARPTPVDITARLSEWHEIRAKEVKYLNSGNRKAYAVYRAADPEQRQAMLAEQKTAFYARYQTANLEGENEREERIELGPERRERDSRSRLYLQKSYHLSFNGRPEAKTLDGLRNLSGCRLAHTPQRATVLLPSNARAGMERGRTAVADRLRRPRDGDRAAVGGGGREVDTVVGQYAAELRERDRRQVDLQREEFDQIKRELDGKRLLAAVSRSHGVLAEKYEITKGKDGSDRIRCGQRNLNVSDFLTHELRPLPAREARSARRVVRGRRRRERLAEVAKGP